LLSFFCSLLFLGPARGEARGGETRQQGERATFFYLFVTLFFCFSFFDVVFLFCFFFFEMVFFLDLFFLAFLFLLYLRCLFFYVFFFLGVLFFFFCVLLFFMSEQRPCGEEEIEHERETRRRWRRRHAR